MKSDDARTMTLEDLCRLSGATPRQVRYFMNERAVSPPEGKTRAARYTAVHLDQVAEVLHAQQRRGLSVPEVAEARRYKARGRGRTSTEMLREVSPRGNHLAVVVYPITERVGIYCASSLTPSEARTVAELKKVAGLSKSVIPVVKK
jgi:DNA-binding transcriptional MerR regulator